MTSGSDRLIKNICEASIQERNRIGFVQHKFVALDLECFCGTVLPVPKKKRIDTPIVQKSKGRFQDKKRKRSNLVVQMKKKLKKKTKKNEQNDKMHKPKPKLKQQ